MNIEQIKVCVGGNEKQAHITQHRPLIGKKRWKKEKKMVCGGNVRTSTTLHTPQIFCMKNLKKGKKRKNKNKKKKQQVLCAKLTLTQTSSL